MRSRRKHRYRTGLIAVVAVVVLAALAAGTFLVKRYAPSKEWMDGYKYFEVDSVVSLKRLLNQSILKSWSSKMIKKSLEAYFFTLKNKIVFCKKQFQNMSVFCFVSTEIV